jgi:6-phosphogluconolactonase (cycloisomerase 2 family)
MKYLSISILYLLTLAATAVAQNQFVYVNNQTFHNTISAFQINSDGSLTQISGSPFLSGGNGAQGPIGGLAIAAESSGNYLYATNGANGTVSALKIIPSNGSLSPVPGSPFRVGGESGPYYVAASADGRFLFVTNSFSTQIRAYAISPRTGSLVELPGSPFAAGANIEVMKVTANGKFLIATANSINALAVFSISPKGALTPVSGSPFAASGSAAAVDSNCANNQVFAVSNSTYLIDAYSLASDGSLTPVSGSPFSNGTTGTGNNSFDLVLSPNSQFLFTTDSFTQDISSFAVSSAGSLSPVEGSPFFTSEWTGGTAITHGGDFLYTVLFASGEIDARSVSSTGALTAVPGTPFGPGNENSPDGEVNSVITFPPPRCSQF